MAATNRLLIQVVPRLTPGRCGVSDQAVLLAKGIKDEFGIESAFVVLNSDARSGLPNPVVYCRPSELLENGLKLTKGQPGSMLVHVSGYGYSPDGAPALLAEALAGIRRSGRFRVAAYFHELFATGMPWKKAFWFSGRQRKAVQRIAEDAELLVTSTRHHASWLETEPVRRCNIPVRLLPVISAAGEAQEPVSQVNRERAMAVFGLPASRRRAYRELSALGTMLHTLGIREIFDIGPEFDTPPLLGDIPITRKGVQPAGDLVEVFSHLTFGFVPHPPHCLAKSSIFASFCAQGTIPILAAAFSGEVDGLRDGVHLVSPRTLAGVLQSGFEDCSRAAWHWYRTHRLHMHAEFYAQWLQNAAAEPATEASAIPVVTGGSSA